MSETTRPMTDTPKSFGIYLYLFHGRKTPDEDMDDWGIAGPILGPLGYVHTTYASDIKISYLDANGDEQEDIVFFVDDLVYYDGVYYGDWSATTLDRCDPSRIQPYDPKKAKEPARDHGNPTPQAKTN